MTDRARIPCLLVAGYLGAGKTTLINRWLRNSGGLRLGILVNDFGDLSIDADLIEAQDGNLMSLAGGCVCCSVGSDLIGAMMALQARTPPPDLLIIETSGVALPEPIARSLQLAGDYVLAATLVLADTTAVREQAADRYVGDTIRLQLAQADIIVLTKQDLPDAQDESVLRQWLARAAPRARALAATDLPALTDGLLADLSLAREESLPSVGTMFAPPREATDAHGTLAGIARQRLRRLSSTAGKESASRRFESRAWWLPQPVDTTALLALLARPEWHLVRAKGIVRTGADAAVVLQMVGARQSLTPTGATATEPVDRAGQLVCIALRDQSDFESLDRVMTAQFNAQRVTGT